MLIDNNNFLNDKSFLLKLDNEKNKKVFVKITVLNNNEIPIQDIEGKIIAGGNINIDGTSAMRRTASISFIAEEGENNLSNIDNLLSINKRVKLSIGLENNIDNKYDKIIWFKQGIFIINSLSLSHSATSVSINLNLKDKMCLLNGEAGGNLPTSVTFDSYDQLDENGNRISVKNSFYDIIKTSVINYGKEGAENVLIEDVPLQNKQIVHWTAASNLYFDPRTSIYQIAAPPEEDLDNWKIFNYNDEIGYIYTDFIYPKELKTSINANITSGVLDEIVKYLGNHEYYYDIDGRFIFREKKNYLNSSYDPTINTRLDNGGRDVKILSNGLSILDNTNYQVDFTNNNQYSYIFSENNSIVTSYSNSFQYSNIKNDFHIWGKRNNKIIHYHLVLKRKPKITEFGTYEVYYLRDSKNEYTGRLRLATKEEIDKGLSDSYTPEDWRAELYLKGLEAIEKQIRPDIYQQELIDLFDDIYNMKDKCFKADIVNKPNELSYFFDYLEPSGKMQDYSVDNIGTRIYSMQQDNITKLYNMNIPDVCLININMPEDIVQEEEKKCLSNGNLYSHVSEDIYNKIAVGAIGYSAQDTARSLLNKYTNYNEIISIQCMPIYYLEPNTRIRVDDMTTNIHGDYMIKSINLPIGGGAMSISASRIKGLSETLS